MMCKEVQEKLKRYIKGKLDAASSKELLEHLEFCKECREKEEFLRSDGKVFLEAKEFEVPEGLFEEVMESVRQPPPRKPRLGIRSIFRGLSRPVRWSTAASFIIVFILGLVIGAWGISITNKMLIRENADLIKLVGYIQKTRPMNAPIAAAVRPRIEARVFDEEDNLIAVQALDSFEDLLHFIKGQDGSLSPGARLPVREEEPPDARAKMVRYE